MLLNLNGFFSAPLGLPKADPFGGQALTWLIIYYCLVLIKQSGGEELEIGSCIPIPLEIPIEDMKKMRGLLKKANFGSKS